MFHVISDWALLVVICVAIFLPHDANPGRIKSSERTGERRLSATRLPVLDK